MLRTFFFLYFIGVAAQAQYEEYESYQTFSDIDEKQRDFGLVFLPSLIYTSVDESNSVTGATVNDRSRDLLFYDVKLGYIFRGGFYFGILYSGETVDINTDSPNNSRESVGFSLGYTRHGLSFIASFLPYSKQTLEGTTGTDAAEYSDGLGFQVDLAYLFRLNPYFSLGPQLTYKSYQYGQAESVATSINADADSSHSVITPMLTLMVNLFRG